MKYGCKVLSIVGLLLVSVAAFCNTNFYTQVERQVNTARLNNSARVDIEVKWSKDEYYKVRKRMASRPRFDTKVRTSYKNTVCAGVLLNNGYVVTSASCVRRHSGFRAERVKLSFSNGKNVTVKGRQMRVKDGIAQVKVDSSFTQGIVGVEVVSLKEGMTLQDVYGNEVAVGLQSFLVTHGVVSPRAARMTGRKPNLKLGEPFFWKGKVVAVFNSIPRRLPVSLFGQISEDFLSVFRG